MMEFIELRMKVTVSKFAALKINICIYIVNNETSNSTNSLQNQPKKHRSSNKYKI